MKNNEDLQTKKEIDLMNILRVLIKNNRFELIGINSVEIKVIKQVINESEPNPEANKFPDFICGNNSFIELFSVSSSLSKKGSKQLKKNSDTLISHEKKIISGQSQIRETSFITGHSIENLRKSIKISINKHINSLKKSDLVYEIKIFFFDNLEESNYLECLLPENQKYPNSYKISYDYILLKQLAEYKEDIDYVIFLTQKFNGDYSLEILNLSSLDGQIKKLMNLSPYMCCSSKGIETYTSYRLDL
ncbi:hypothetical protein [Vagococcus fluvialis]|uniref:hypothetical protein n=1 Tax=Vagococcus fluvialis TaxID=2738 RepID=UPI001A8F89F4|nr:hypothetical protein [Vagococcus fluvialis]MBO0488185.1 hypothetical protein [Vagococcus fluvialis]